MPLPGWNDRHDSAAQLYRRHASHGTNVLAIQEIRELAEDKMGRLCVLLRFYELTGDGAGRSDDRAVPCDDCLAPRFPPVARR
jgi:hypothetical protein